MTEKLLPCPFCGSTNVDPEGWASTDRAGPACDNCAGTADTVELWNTRYSQGGNARRFNCPYDGGFDRELGPIGCQLIGMEMECVCEARAAQAASGELRQGGNADDIRAQGWTVAVHNDYRLNGEAHTFWLFTKDGRAIKGEGKTDGEALNQIRAALASQAPSEASSGVDDAKIVYVKRWRTLVRLPVKYADEIVEALRSPPGNADREQVAKVLATIFHGDTGEWRGFLSKAEALLAFPWSSLPRGGLSAPPENVGRQPLVAVTAALAATISLLERTPKAKGAAPSDKMFDQMMGDYRAALAKGRDALSAFPREEQV